MLIYIRYQYLEKKKYEISNHLLYDWVTENVQEFERIVEDFKNIEEKALNKFM